MGLKSSNLATLQILKLSKFCNSPNHARRQTLQVSKSCKSQKFARLQIMKVYKHEIRESLNLANLQILQVSNLVALQ